MAVTGHTAHTGHMRALDTERESQVTHGDLDHGVRVHMAPDRGPIEEKDCFRDLGIRVSTDLTFSTQIDMVVESGSRMAGWALRTFRRRGRGLMLTILRSLIQPRLDYCSQLWSPRDQSSINRLESVQRQFISKIRDDSLVGMNYCERDSPT